MKLILLLESKNGDAKEIIEEMPDKKILYVDTKHCDELHEYRYLLDSVTKFSKSKDDILLANFSGKDSIVSNLGDECSEMLITLSDNKKSKYFTECPQKTFLNLVRIFETGD